MNRIDFLRNYISGNDLYYGKKKVCIVKYYDIFDFVDLTEESNQVVFALPISVLNVTPDYSKYIYLDRINDLSKFGGTND